MENPKVTVITSSIGRSELYRSMKSVHDQTYNKIQKIRHMIFINGEKFWPDGKRNLNRFKLWYEDHMEFINVFYVREETGDYGVGPGAGDVFAAAPFLTNSEIICFLNDDDFYEPNHVESLVKLITEHNLDWAYSLRKFVNVEKGDFIANDDFASLGFWPSPYPSREGEDDFLVDNSCFAMTRQVAKEIGAYWLKPHSGDREVLRILMRNKTKAGCTGLYTVNYKIGDQKYLSPNFIERIPSANLDSIRRFGGKRPWADEGPTFREFDTLAQTIFERA